MPVGVVVGFSEDDDAGAGCAERALGLAVGEATLPPGVLRVCRVVEAT